MTKKQKAEFVKRLLWILSDGVDVRSWKQVTVATEVLTKTLAK